MGAEKLCTVKLGRRRIEGKAHLESSEVTFRGGDLRLKIAFKDMQRIVERAGALSITFPGGTASFDLGPDAAKWAEKIRNPKSRIDKLGIKPGQRVAVLSLDDPALLEELSERGAAVSQRVVPDADAIFLGAERLSGLARMAALVPNIKRDGAIWTVTPKGKGGVKDTDVMAAGKAAGLVDVKVVSYSDTHSAAKFVIPKANR